MNITRISIGLVAALFMVDRVSAATNETDSWSALTNGLQARLTFVEKPKVNGTRLLVPFIELKNGREGSSEGRCRDGLHRQRSLGHRRF
jgi:hypothetical protein